MIRRAFLSALAAIPFVRKIPKEEPPITFKGVPIEWDSSMCDPKWTTSSVSWTYLPIGDKNKIVDAMLEAEAKMKIKYADDYAERLWS